MKYPKVIIEHTDLIDSFYKRRGYSWSAVKLIEQSKKYKVYDVPVSFINLSDLYFTIPNIDYFIYHVNRINKTDLKYPIIFDNEGAICDGWHRMCKAILLGKTTIKAIKLEEMPDHDSYTEQN